MRSIAVLGVLGAMLVPAAAHAVPVATPGFVGVMADGPVFASPELDSGHELDLMVDAGVESLRVGFYWDLAQPYPPGTPAPPGYEDVAGVPTSFARTDTIVAEAARRNLRVLPVVLRSPVWARADPGALWSPPRPDTYGRYSAFVSALVRRYKPGGSFWGGRAAGVAAIRSWQIWNEPSGSAFWTIQPGLPAYTKLLDSASRAVHGADPGAEVVLAGLTDHSWRALRRLYRLGARGRFDVAALNPFSFCVRDVLEIVRRGRRVMARNGDRRKPLIVSELSWPSARGRTRSPLGFEETERGQARKLRVALLTLAERRRRLGVRAVYWYTWMTADDNPFYSFSWSGLRRLEGFSVVSKPAYYALRRVARRLRAARL